MLIPRYSDCLDCRTTISAYYRRSGQSASIHSGHLTGMCKKATLDALDNPRFQRQPKSDLQRLELFIGCFRPHFADQATPEDKHNRPCSIGAQ